LDDLAAFPRSRRFEQLEVEIFLSGSVDH